MEQATVLVQPMEASINQEGVPEQEAHATCAKASFGATHRSVRATSLRTCVSWANVWRTSWWSARGTCAFTS